MGRDCDRRHDVGGEGNLTPAYDEQHSHVDPLGARTSEGSSRIAFPEVLRDVCSWTASQLRSTDAVLYLYDKLAGSFGAAAGIGKLAGQVDHERVPEQEQRVLADCLNAGTPVYVAPGGEAIAAFNWVGESVSLIPLIGAEPVGVLLAVTSSATPDARRQVTVQAEGRGAAERILHARPDVNHACLFRRMLEVGPGGMAVVEGPGHVYSYATVGFRELLQEEDLPLLGRPARGILPAMPADRGSALLDEVRGTKMPSHLSDVKTSDQFGSRYFELHLVPDLDSHGNVAAIFILVWPRTDEVVTREALEATILRLAEAQSVFTAVLDGTINGIIFANTELRVVYANGRIRDLFGIEPEELVGRDIRTVAGDLLTEAAESESFKRRSISLYERFEETAVDEIELLRPTPRSLERYSGPVYTADGELYGRIEVYSDVTAIRNVQRNKDEFMSLVSHELKTPVTSIKGYAQLLQRRAQRESLSEQTIAAYGVIERQAARMQELIDNLLDLSRLETGRLALHVADLNLIELAQGVIEIAQMTAENHTIALERPAGSIWIRGDAKRLEQVFMNLLRNAVRYSEDATIVKVRLAQADDTVTFSVTDQGHGIPESDRHHIFERFYRAPDSSSTGMGIGLYITKGIVEEHGGTLTLESDLGKGSVFTVTLPRSGHESSTRPSQFT